MLFKLKVEISLRSLTCRIVDVWLHASTLHDTFTILLCRCIAYKFIVCILILVPLTSFQHVVTFLSFLILQELLLSKFHI